MKKNILAEINRVREVMGLREQLEIVPDAEGTKEDPIQHTPTVAEAEEGKYYQNTKTKQIYLFQDGKYTEIVESGDDVKGEEEVAMIEGIAISDLHPYAYESLKNKTKISAARMLKMMAGCYDDDEEMQPLVGYASNYTSTAWGGQKINHGFNRKKGRLYLSYRNGHGGQTWKNLCDFPDNIRDGKWLSLPGFEFSEELFKSINDYWEAASGLKNMTWEEDYSVSQDGGMPVEQANQRYEAGKKLMWKWDDDEAWFLAVR